MSEAKERILSEFLKEATSMSPQEFREQYTFPFLVREVTVEAVEEADLKSRDARRKSEKMHRLLGRHSGYVLGMIGERSVEAVMKRTSRTTTRKSEQRVLYLEGKDKAVSLGTHESRNVVLANDLAEGISPTQATVVAGDYPGDWYVLDEDSEWGTYIEGGRIPAGKPRRIVDAEWLRLGSTLEYRFFSPQGLFAYVKFNAKLSRAKKKQKAAQG